jgi:hypothetical protein
MPTKEPKCRNTATILKLDNNSKQARNFPYYPFPNFEDSQYDTGTYWQHSYCPNE